MCKDQRSKIASKIQQLNKVHRVSYFHHSRREEFKIIFILLCYSYTDIYIDISRLEIYAVAKRLTPEKHDSRAMRQRRYGKTALFLSIIHGYLSRTILFIRESVDGFYHLPCATNCCWYDCSDDYEDAHDWSRIASYLVIVTSREVTIAAALNFKISALRFVNVTEEVTNAIEENSIPKNPKDVIKFGVTLIKRKI